MINLSDPNWNTRPSRYLEGLIIKAQALKLEAEAKELLSKMLLSEEQISLYLKNSPSVQVILKS